MTSGDKGEAPDTMKRTRPPSLSFILLNTNLSHIGDGFLPKNIPTTRPLCSVKELHNVEKHLLD